METKACIKCDQILSISEFYLRGDGAGDGYFGECKECKKSRSKKHYIDNTEHHHKMVKRRYETHGRFARYGLSLELYDEMLKKQGSVCALCKAEKPGGKGKWHIDHKGGTIRSVFNQCKADSVRGLLCHRCNVSLGHYEKLLKRIGRENIMRYLKE